MPQVKLRKLAALSFRVLAHPFLRKATRRERLQAMKKEMLRSYERAGTDPEFLRECEEVERAFQYTLSDGLPKERFVR
jgi:hypothetical protein